LRLCVRFFLRLLSAFLALFRGCYGFPPFQGLRFRANPAPAGLQIFRRFRLRPISPFSYVGQDAAGSRPLSASSRGRGKTRST
jgi:hypothetical protein